MSKIGGRMGLYGLATILPSAVGFLFLPVLTRQLSKTDFGTMSALTALYNFFFIAFTFYLDRSLGRLYFCYEGTARRELLGSLFIAVGSIATVGMLVTAALGPVFENYYPAISARRLDWYALSVYFSVFIYFARMLYVAEEKPENYLWISLSLSVATVAGYWWFIIVKREGIDGWLQALIWSNAIVALPAAVAVARSCSPRFRWAYIRQAFRYAGPMVPAFFCNWIQGSVDRLLVGKWAGMDANALYGAASQLGNILPVLFLPVFMIYTPMFYRLSSSGGDDTSLVTSCNRLLLLLIAAAGCLLIAASPLLAGIVLPASYASAGGTFAWLVVAGCLSQTASIAVLGLYQSRRTELVLAASAGAALVAIVIELSLIPVLGRKGAVLGQLFSNGTLMTVQFWLAERTHGAIVPRSCLIRNTGAIVAMGLLAEVQTMYSQPLLWLPLQAGLLVFIGAQLWSEKNTLLELWSKDLWKTPAPVILAV